MMLQLYDGAAPEPRVEQQFALQDRPGVFEWVAGLLAMGLPLHPQVPEAPKVEYQFVLEQMEVEEEDWVCSICLDDHLENPDIKVQHPAECHTLHNTCLQRWLAQTPTCPVCRAARTPMLARPKTSD